VTQPVSWIEQAIAAYAQGVAIKRKQAGPERIFTAKGLATRARIVAAASSAVSEHGVAGMSMDDIQARAGVSNSQIYHYFRDKQELIQAVIGHAAEIAVAYQGPVGEVDSIEALRAWADFHVQFQVQSQFAGCALGSLVPQVARTNPEARDGLGIAFASWAQSLVDGLRTMQRRGDLRSDADPEKLATSLLAALEGGLVLAQSQQSIEPLRLALESAVDHIEILTRQ
jgi:TetR/AcrR family transcriptional regulator, transcriptional repressor for nem operon